MTVNTNAAHDFLMGGGTVSAKFPTIGTSVTGTICRQPEVTQQTDITTGEPKFWPDGRPRQQLVVHLQTAERDPAVINDDGVRTLYIKANMHKAVREAVRRSGALLEVGGTLTVTYTGDDAPTQRGMNAPKLYSASYVGAPAATANEFLQQNPPTSAATTPPTAVTQPVTPAVAPPAPAAPAAVAPAPQPITPAAAPAGVSPEALAALQQLTPEQRAALGLA